MLLNNRTRDKRKSQFLAGMTAPTFGDGEGTGRKSGPRSLRTESGPDLIEPRAKQTSMALVRVTDSGPRVDPRLVERMFQPFFTTKSSGMGMGLSICKTIIEAHGGQLTASANNPHGMEFQIILPLHQRGPNEQA